MMDINYAMSQSLMTERQFYVEAKDNNPHSFQYKTGHNYNPLFEGTKKWNEKCGINITSDVMDKDILKSGWVRKVFICDDATVIKNDQRGDWSVDKVILGEIEKLVRIYSESDAYEYIKRKGSDFDDIPKEFQTYDTCLEYMKTHLELSGCIPTHLPRQELYNELFASNIDVMKYTPNKFITREMCDTIMKEELDNKLQYFGYLPDWFKTTEICEYFVTKEPRQISHVPGKIMTDDFILRMIKYDEECVQFIDEKYLTNEYLI